GAGVDRSELDRARCDVEFVEVGRIVTPVPERRAVRVEVEREPAVLRDHVVRLDQVARRVETLDVAVVGHEQPTAGKEAERVRASSEPAREGTQRDVVAYVEALYARALEIVEHRALVAREIDPVAPAGG